MNNEIIKIARKKITNYRLKLDIAINNNNISRATKYDSKIQKFERMIVRNGGLI